ncbi:hypothetical protein [Ideonella sp. A 288]|uniref:hypothetical protein n=1 Tax=Ideonella sp. A 288 TaxID=1962181 RepID=UPI001186A725|nr:hypothetical protein [Ideonella sp. A 288]
MTGVATRPPALAGAVMALTVALASIGASAGAAEPMHGHAHDHGHAHAHGDETAPQADLPAAPDGLVRRLEDVQRRSGRGRIAWQTFWTLCWQPVAGAVRYEARLTTSEGAPRRPTPVDRGCHRVEVAAGENAVAAGLYRRDLMLAMQSAQSSVRVRAVFADGRTTAWTAEQPVGVVGPSDR